MANKKFPQRIEVEWLDAEADSSWKTMSEIEKEKFDYNFTLGYEIRTDKLFLYIGGTYDRGNGNFNNTIKIPLSLIKSTRRVRIS